MTSRQSTIVAIIGAILTAAGGLLPWAKMGSVEVSGTSGDGIFAIVGGVLAAIVAYAQLNRPNRAAPLFLTIVGVLLAWLYADKVMSIGGLAEPGNIFSVSVGIGVWVGLIGAVLLALFGWAAKGRAPVTDQRGA